MPGILYPNWKFERFAVYGVDSPAVSWYHREQADALSIPETQEDTVWIW